MEKISARQFKMLIFLYTIGTSILIIPSGLAAEAKQDAWIGAMAGVGLSLLVVWLYAALWSQYPRLTFVGICREVLGRFWGSAVSFVFVLYSFIGASTVLYYVGNFITTQIMPETPIWSINALFALIVVLGVRMGLEVLGRAAEILLPWFIILYVLFMAAISPEIKPENMFPVFESSMKSLIWDAITYACTAALPFLSFFMVFPQVRDPENARKGFYLSTFLGGIAVSLITLMCILVLGVFLSANSMFPSYLLAQNINIAQFIQRIEAIIAGIWFITVFFKIVFYFYGGVTSLAEILQIRDYRILTLPLGMILIVFSLVVYPSVTYMQKWDTEIYIPYILTIGLILPLGLMMIGSVKNKLK